MPDTIRLQANHTSTAASSFQLAEEVLDFTIHLDGNVSTPIHIVKYSKGKIRPRLVVFDRSTPLLTWCKEQGATDAINAGFTLHHTETLLGEHRTGGRAVPHLPFTAPWDQKRGTLHVTAAGSLSLAPRGKFPDEPEGDLIQGAPLLVERGKSLMEAGTDPEGISASSDQFDDDWTVERFPRAAIGTNDQFIWCVATDGYDRPGNAAVNAGLSLIELAEIFVVLGASEALNLDGGSSATLVSSGRLVNKPRAGKSGHYACYPYGRPIPSAITFEAL